MQNVPHPYLSVINTHPVLKQTLQEGEEQRGSGRNGPRLNFVQFGWYALLGIFCRPNTNCETGSHEAEELPPADWPVDLS